MTHPLSKAGNKNHNNLYFVIVSTINMLPANPDVTTEIVEKKKKKKQLYCLFRCSDRYRFLHLVIMLLCVITMLKDGLVKTETVLCVI